MAVYVDNMYKTSIGNFRGMRMSHMVADTIEELHSMARKIGMKKAWFQRSPSGDHYDVSMSYRRRAVAEGAFEISMRECAAICWCHRNKLFYSSPSSAVKQMLSHAMAIMRGDDDEQKAPEPIARKRATGDGQRSNGGVGLQRRKLPVAPLPREIRERPVVGARSQASATKGLKRRRPPA